MRFTFAIFALPLLTVAAPPPADQAMEESFPVFGKDPVSLTATPSITPGKIPIPGFSKAFQLVVHVVDKAHDPSPSLDGQLVVPVMEAYARWFGKIDNSSFEAIKRSPFFS